MRPAVLLIGLLLPLAAALAEVSAPGPRPGGGGFFSAERASSAGGEDPGAWPLWRPFRAHLSPDLQLNPEGEANGDGPAGFAIDPRNGRAAVVWSWFDGADYEAVISEWNGEFWTPFQRLTDNLTDDLDPRIEIAPDRRRIVTFWRSGGGADGPDEVWQIERLPGADFWSEPALVTEPIENGRHSDVTWHEDGGTYVAYQSGDGLAPWQVVVAWRFDGEPGFAQRLPVADSDYHGEIGTEPLVADVAVRIHSREGRLWVDWLQDDVLMGYSVYQGPGQWSPPEYLEYRHLVDRAGSFSAGLDMARQSVRWRVLR